MFVLVCKMWIKKGNTDPGKGGVFGKREGGQGRETREDNVI